MTDHGILFKPEMVRAGRSGLKTQTRRILPPLPSSDEKYPTPVQLMCRSCGVGEKEFKSDRCRCQPAHLEWTPCSLPRYRIGDRLWTRESWRTASPAYDDLPPSDMGGEEDILYEADGLDGIRSKGRFRVGMHMPRWASRSTLIITAVRVQLLQEINDEDSLAEGVTVSGAVAGTDVDIDGDWWPGGPRRQYQRLWNSINQDPGIRWHDNPWVVAYTFTWHNKNIDNL